MYFDIHYWEVKEYESDLLGWNRNLIVFDLEKGSEEVYHKNEKQNNVRIDGLQILKENFDGIKNNELLLSTNYKITKDGALKNIQISISKNKNKDDFEIKY